MLAQPATSLPVDVEQHVLSVYDRAFHRWFRSAVAMSEDHRVFQQSAAGDELAELSMVDEAIVLSVLLGLSRWAGGYRYRYIEFAVTPEQHLRNCSLTRS